MGLVASAFRNLVGASAAWHPVPTYQDGIPQPMQLNYQAFANEGYGGNEIIYAAIEELASSASEPKMAGRVGKAAIYSHPLLSLLESPNPFVDRFQFWATIIMYLYISGNAFALKVRSGSGKVRQLWLLRPDRIRIVPDAVNFIKRYDYMIGDSEAIPLPVSDVIHWRKRNPLNDFYGMSPLKVIAPRIDTDNYLRSFVKAFLENAAVPAGILSTKQKMSDVQREMVREQLRSQFGRNNWHETMVLDGAEATFTPITAQLGQRGIVAPDLDEINEARLAMPFGVPLSLIGARLGMSSSSYGNRKSDKEFLWDGTLAPLYKELEGPLNRDLTPDFPNIDFVGFDLSDVRALQEDRDKVFARWGKAYTEGWVPLEVVQNKTGLEESERSGLYLVPLNMVPTPSQVFDDALETGEQVPPPRLTERTDTAAPDLPEPSKAPEALPTAPATGPTNRIGRPPLQEDPIARDLYEHGEKLRRKNPGMTLEQVAGQVGVALSTYKRWRATFGRDVNPE